MENLSFKNFMEMPIQRMDLIGQWGPEAKRAYGYTKQDVGILANPSGAAKIKKLWSNSKQNFNLIFLRSAQARKHVEVGRVTSEWVKENLLWQMLLEL